MKGLPNERTLSARSPLDLASEEPGTAQLVAHANSFLDAFTSAIRTGNLWVGESIPGVLGLFLVELDSQPSRDIDRHVWVIVGDLPPAYISTDYAKAPKAAIEGYVAEMEDWVQAVENGASVADLIPVNAAPTRENAAALHSRLCFIKDKIVPSLL